MGKSLVIRNNLWVEVDDEDLLATDILVDSLYNLSPLIPSSQLGLDPPRVATPPVPAPEVQELSLHAAVSQGTIDRVRYYIQNGNLDLLNSADPLNGDTALHLAVNANQEDIFWELLHAGADPSITNDHFKTPLHKSKLHYHLATRVWAQRASLPCQDKIADACFEVLSKNFIINLPQFHSDMLILLKAVSRKRISDFVATHLSGHCNNPLYSVAIQPTQHLQLGKLLLDHAKPEVLIKENNRGQNFLSIAAGNHYEGLIDYARTCQQGALAATVDKIIPLPVDSSELKKKLKSLQDNLKSTENKIQQTKGQRQTSLNTIESLKKSIQQGEALIEELTASVPELNTQIEACALQIKECDKRALLKELADNKQKLIQIQEQAALLEARLQAMEGTEQPFRPSVGQKRTFAEVTQNNNNNTRPDFGGLQ